MGGDLADVDLTDRLNEMLGASKLDSYLLVGNASRRLDRLWHAHVGLLHAEGDMESNTTFLAKLLAASINAGHYTPLSCLYANLYSDARLWTITDAELEAHGSATQLAEESF